MQVNTTFSNSGFVLYKFDFEKNFSQVSFVGSQISVNDLRNLILNHEEKQSKLSMKVQRRNRDYLELYKLSFDGNTIEAYKNDELVASAARIIIRRANKSILNCIPEYMSKLFTQFNINLFDLEKLAPILDESDFFLIRPSDLSLLDKIITSKTYYLKQAWIAPYLKSKSLIFIFATHGTGRFQGYAKVTGCEFLHNGNVKLALEWLRINEVHFSTISKELHMNSLISNATFSKLSSPEAMKVCELFETSMFWYDFTKSQTQAPVQVKQMLPPPTRVQLEDDAQSTSATSCDSPKSKVNVSLWTLDFHGFDNASKKIEEPAKNKIISSRDPRARFISAQMGQRERSRSNSKQ